VSRCQGWRVDVADRERDPQAHGKISAKPFVRVGVSAADVMMHVPEAGQPDLSCDGELR